MSSRLMQKVQSQVDSISRYLSESGIPDLINRVRELLVKRAPIGILFITFFSTFSIFAIWWSLSERIAVIDDKNSKMSAVAVLEHEVLELEKSWSEEDFEKLMGDISESERYIFPHYKSVAEWLYEEGDFAKNAGLDLKYYLSEVQSDNELEGVDMVPIKIKLKPSKSSSKNGYWKMMEFLRRMDRTSWKHEIVIANMGSEGEGATKMDIQFNVWMQRPNGKESGHTPSDQIDPLTGS